MKWNRLFIAVGALIVILGVFLILFLNRGEKAVHEKQKTLSKEDLIKLNQVQRDQELNRMQAFAERLGYSMTQTQTGLMYQIHDSTGNSTHPEIGNQVVYAMLTTNLNGDTIDFRTEENPAKTLINKDNTIRGLHEGLQYVGLGEKATFIIPSHLAYGLYGNDENIGPWETLVYKVNVIEIIRD